MNGMTKIYSHSLDFGKIHIFRSSEFVPVVPTDCREIEMGKPFLLIDFSYHCHEA